MSIALLLVKERCSLPSFGSPERGRRGWTVRYEDAKERFAERVEAVKKGEFSEFAKQSMRVSFPDGCGDFESTLVGQR